MKVYLLYNDIYERNLKGVYTTYKKAVEAIQKDFKYYKEQGMFDVDKSMGYRHTDVWLEEVDVDIYYEDYPEPIYFTNKGKKVCKFK